MDRRDFLKLPVAAAAASVAVKLGAAVPPSTGSIELLPGPWTLIGHSTFDRDMQPRYYDSLPHVIRDAPSNVHILGVATGEPIRLLKRDGEPWGIRIGIEGLMASWRASDPPHVVSQLYFAYQSGRLPRWMLFANERQYLWIGDVVSIYSLDSHDILLQGRVDVADFSGRHFTLKENPFWTAATS